jgi:predicted ArsR family transcriptional regulator
MPSRFLQKQLEERGLIAFDTVKSGQRGRPQHVAKVTSKGQAYINFAK